MKQHAFAFARGPERESFAPGAWRLHGRALPVAAELVAAVAQIAEGAPFRHMTTPGGGRMSAAMTHCGRYGWVTDAAGYRYTEADPISGQDWPDMPQVFRDLAVAAAHEAGYPAFQPDSCLINRYEPGARMARHQDRNEGDFAAPIVSVSLGLPMVFEFGGLRRTDPAQRMVLEHGDVLVWGGPSRLAFHGVLPLRDGLHPRLGRCRVNLTFRRAGA